MASAMASVVATSLATDLLLEVTSLDTRVAPLDTTRDLERSPVERLTARLTPTTTSRATATALASRPATARNSALASTRVLRVSRRAPRDIKPASDSPLKDMLPVLELVALVSMAK
uniref:Uncharacterized protein n=1 Tax=Rhipicephalus appendiculatus TaxID=34631 RepID=A0A131YF02_RHIAP